MNLKLIYGFKMTKINLLITAPLEFTLGLQEKIKTETNLFYLYGKSTYDIKKSLSTNKIDAWICSPCPTYKIDQSFVSLCPELKFIATPSTGTNHIDLDYLKLNNIKVWSLRDSKIVNKIYASSEFTFALMIALIRKIPDAINEVKKNNWRNVEANLRGRELSGMNIGIIGYGRIGSNLARYCNAFNMRVTVYDPYVNVNDNQILQVNKLELMLPEIDILVVCIHLTKDTFGFINDTIFSNLKKGSFFINTSRGEIIRENALIRYLQSGHIQAAAVDVISDELNDNHQKNILIEYAKENNNLLITPHIAGLTYDSETKAQTAAYEAVFDFFYKY